MGGKDEVMDFNLYKDDYQEFINEMRKRLSHSAPSHNLPVLMPQTEAVRWLDLRLTDGDNTIVLRLDQRNLYVRGYSRDGGQTFWEFSDSQMIPGSTPLAYSGSYVSREDTFTFVAAARVDRYDLFFGSENLAHDIYNLATTENPNSRQNNVLQQCAKALLRLTQMFAESVRFQLITQHIYQNWNTPQPLPRYLVDIQQAFQDFSSSVQRVDEPIWELSTPLPNIPVRNRANIWTVGQAMAALGILLYVDRPSNIVNLRPANRSAGSFIGVSYYRTLVSICYVRVINIDGETPGNLYGTVKVNNFWGEYTVYDKTSGEAEKKGPGEYATLTDPWGAIQGEDVFVISVSLKDHDWLSPDDEIAQGDIVWEPRSENITFDNYNKLLESTVSGAHGSVAVGYSVIRMALHARVKVVLINGDGESPANVFGTIKASVPLVRYTESPLVTTLFEIDKEGNPAPVHPGEEIPLTRSTMAVTMQDGVTITAYLWDYDIVSRNDQIASGSVSFNAIPGTDTQSIHGEYGEIQVSITFE